jgi:hypothetical protein
VSTLTLGSAVLGNFNVNVTGTNGILSHSFMLTINVGDLSLDCGGPCPPIDTPSPGILSFKVRSTDSLAGIMTLAASASPGMTVSLSTTRVLLGTNGTGFVAAFSVTVRAVQGTYNLTITATIGSISRSRIVTVNIVPPPSPCPRCQVAFLRTDPHRWVLFAPGQDLTGSRSAKPLGVGPQLQMGATTDRPRSLVPLTQSAGR